MDVDKIIRGIDTMEQNNSKHLESLAAYDSSVDTMEHKTRVMRVGTALLNDFVTRLHSHDSSKLEDPEKSCYDKYIPMLKKAKYGSTEYEQIRDKMAKEGLDHHYQVNRHHPEHFEHGIEDMTIVDLLEYFVDTYAASTKSDTPYGEGLKRNAKVHKLPKELVRIFENTVKEYFQ